MSMLMIALGAIGGLILGLGGGILLFRAYCSNIKKQAHIEAKEWIQKARENVELRLIDEKERIQEIEMEAWSKEESHLLKIEENIEDLEEQFVEKKQKNDNKYSQERQKTVEYENSVKKYESSITDKQKNLDELRKKVKELSSQFVEKISEHIGLDKSMLIEDIKKNLLTESEQRASSILEKAEEEAKEYSEELAKKVLSTVLDRFERAYCPERGISAVYFESPEQRQVLFDDQGENLRAYQEITGCDIIVEPDMEMIGVAGFDPVRRELSRRLLERCLKEKKPLNPNSIYKIAGNIKRELFGQIKRDGDRLAKELKLDGLHPEVRQMMGSLRYRYSFTQNQYFHCGEVGWLAGLIAGELKGTTIFKARRAGMLHDLGKAMDHQLDGGHAVIGADFIKERGEAEDVVHAVRAHHYDETPSTDLAYMVIAADAISGARPGARRSTIESYNQKVTELESIARSFEGVLDCYVLSGGRECRVIVDGRKVDDTTALKLSSEIAKRIEQECNYPGQIKVVVVRETIAIESTRAH